jgi:Flp pilus assembly protein TadG
MKRRISKSLRRRGTAVVEMAVVLPLLLILTLGTIEYGWMLLCLQEMTGVCEQAGRTAATPTATNAIVNTQIASLMAHWNLQSSGYTTTFSPSDVSTAATGNQVSVTISIPYNNIEITYFTLLPLPATISSSTVEIKQGN